MFMALSFSQVVVSHSRTVVVPVDELRFYLGMWGCSVTPAINLFHGALIMREVRGI